MLIEGAAVGFFGAEYLDVLIEFELCLAHVLELFVFNESFVSLVVVEVTQGRCIGVLGSAWLEEEVE